MTDFLTLFWVLLAALSSILYLRWRLNPLHAIPTVGGPSLPILSYIGAFRFVTNARQVLSEGYRRFYGSAFKIALPGQWLVIISGPEMIENLRKRGEDEVSFQEFFDEMFNVRYTSGRASVDDSYHVEVVRDKLMRSLPTVLPAMTDELLLAIPDYINPQGDDWVELNTFHTMERIVARATARVFVGAPLCRDEDYLDLAIQYTTAVVIDGQILNLLPTILRPIVGHLTSNANKTISKTSPYLIRLINERRAKMEQYGDTWDGKPNDMLQWLMEEEVSRGGRTEAVIERVMITNFAAIHTTSNSATHVLYHLAVDPKVVRALREEIEPLVATGGWTKSSLEKMWKLDSVIKESQRYDGINLVSMDRKILKDIVLPDGTLLPKDTLVAAAAHPTHHDAAHYPDADAFRPFRFADMRRAGGEGTKHQFTHTSPDYVPFGHGRFACPGRFFAASELKVLLAFLVVKYDFKLAGGRVERPQNIYFAEAVVPDPNARVMFRRRHGAVARS